MVNIVQLQNVVVGDVKARHCDVNDQRTEKSASVIGHAKKSSSISALKSHVRTLTARCLKSLSCCTLPGSFKLLPSPGEVSESQRGNGTACTNDPAMSVLSLFRLLSFSSALRVFLPVFCACVSFSPGTGHIRPVRCETRYICCCFCLRLHLPTASHSERTSTLTECEGPPASFVFHGLPFNCLPSPDVAAPGSFFTQISTCLG